MSKWRGFVSRLMAMAALVEIGNSKESPSLVVTRLPRVAEKPKPRPTGMATEYERNIKPPKKGKGTRKGRKEERVRRARHVDSQLRIECMRKKSYRRHLSGHNQ